MGHRKRLVAHRTVLMIACREQTEQLTKAVINEETITAGLADKRHFL